jgi:hypothetical protein
MCHLLYEKSVAFKIDDFGLCINEVFHHKSCSMSRKGEYGMQAKCIDGDKWKDATKYVFMRAKQNLHDL